MKKMDVEESKNGSWYLKGYITEVEPEEGGQNPTGCNTKESKWYAPSFQE